MGSFEVSHLHRSDGSATFTQGDYCVVASVNGPIEAQRREENSFEAVVDVIVRPLAGVGGTKERQMEQILQAALQSLICIDNYPRCTLQVTLQVSKAPANDHTNNRLGPAQVNLMTMPPLFHTALLALLDASVPLKGTASSVIVALPREGSPGQTIVDPTMDEACKAKSLHFFGFTASGSLLMAESEGEFSFEDWESAADVGRPACHSHLRVPAGGDYEHHGESQTPSGIVRAMMETKASATLAWR